MQVYALVGSSGTGKSHKAMHVAYENNIDTIIDDGLLIQDGRKLAGFSAKGEATKVQAVKRAIFLDSRHAKEVSDAIEKVKPKKILILGTSKRMIEKICNALMIPQPQKIIYIEEISTEIEISKAKKMRDLYGKHVIPVPTIEIKKDFPGYFIDPLQFIFKKKPGKDKRSGEKSIIRPKFSSLGKLIISEQVIADMAIYVAKRVEGVSGVLKVMVDMNEDGVSINMDIKIKYGSVLKEKAQEVQNKVWTDLEYLTGLIMQRINVVVKALEVPES